MNLRYLLWVCLAAGLAGADARHFAGLEYRFIGPANMGGRATDVEGAPGEAALVYAGFGGGGLWKTVNGGQSWTPLFDKQGNYSVGDIALEPGNPDVVWVGTGESNTRNSVSFGDGVYRSTDGGKTWRHLGLRGTERISRVLIHPTDPRTAWVGALGHAFGPHPDRGVYLTTDRGGTWQKTLYLDDRHGVSDMDINPANPNILYAALWLFERKPWGHTSGSEQGGVFRSVDGGRTWTRLTGGLPKLMGRIGVKVAPSNPSVVYVIAESKEGTLYRSDDGGDSFREVTRNREIVSRGFYYADLRVDPTNENRIYALATNLWVSIDAGKTWKSIVNGTHVDYHALWIDPRNPRRMWVAQDGGLAVTQDAGATWAAVCNIALGQFYQVHADNRTPFYSVMGGLQDNGSWTGPSRTREPFGILNDDWRMVQFGDGFHMINHPQDPDLYLAESQGGWIARTDLRTREQQIVNPYPVSVTGGGAEEARFRFNWNSPFIPSPHDANTVYFGANVLFRSEDFGKSWRAISPDLTTNDKAKQKSAGGPVWFDNSTAEYYSTIISIAESPSRRGDLWVGTDDGLIHRSRDGGANWVNLAANLPPAVADSPVSHIELSSTSPEVAYAAFDRHMFDDFRPHLYRTADGGKTWTRISGDLPETAYLHVVREDPRNPKLLYAGTELGLYASWDGGQRWSALGGKNLPAVAVHDIKVHPRENDLILATHGRSIAILDDIAALQQMTETIAQAPAHLFPPRPALRFTQRPTRYGIGGAVYRGANPPYGALLTYYLKQAIDEKAPMKIEIRDARGELVRVIEKAPRQAGVQRVNWDLRGEAPYARRPPREGEAEEEGGGRGPRGVEVLPGVYSVRLVAGPHTAETKVEVLLDPAVTAAPGELDERRKTALRLWTALDRGNRALRRLDSLAEQLGRIDGMAKADLGEAGKPISKLVEGYRKELESTAGLIARGADAPRLETGPRVIEKLGGLFSLVEGANAAPTAAMRAAVDELTPEFDRQIAVIERFLAQTIAQWNEALRKAGAPTLVTATDRQR